MNRQGSQFNDAKNKKKRKKHGSHGLTRGKGMLEAQETVPIRTRRLVAPVNEYGLASPNHRPRCEAWTGADKNLNRKIH